MALAICFKGDKDRAQMGLFVCNRGDTLQYHGGLWSKELCQTPLLQVFLLGRHYHLTHVNRWSACIGYRIAILCPLATSLQHCTANTQWNSDPMLLDDDTMCIDMLYQLMIFLWQSQVCFYRSPCLLHCPNKRQCLEKKSFYCYLSCWYLEFITLMQ